MHRNRRSAVLALNATSGRRCEICAGHLKILVHVEPRYHSAPVTYYSCDRCAQILIVAAWPESRTSAA